MGAPRANKANNGNLMKMAMNGEKVSVNMTTTTLAQIDFLVDQGYYANRSAFINEAVRKSLDEKQDVFLTYAEKKTTTTNKFFIGITLLGDADLRELMAAGAKCRITGYGVLILDVSDDQLVLDCFESINVVGKVFCSERVKKAFLP